MRRLSSWATCGCVRQGVPVFAGHADAPFEKAVIELSDAILQLDFVFGEMAGGAKPPGWEAFDWTEFHPGDEPSLTISYSEYEDWLGRLSVLSGAAAGARSTLITGVVNRDPTLLNVWPG